MYRVRRKDDGLWHVEQYRWGSWGPVWVRDTTDYLGVKIPLSCTSEDEARQAMRDLTT